MKEFITEDEVEKAVHYLAKSAENFAKWKGRMKFLELHRKSIRAAETLNANGNSMTENKERGEASKAYKDILIEYHEAVYEYELINAYRNAAEAKIEAWRTISSSNRRGNI